MPAIYRSTRTFLCFILLIVNLSACSVSSTTKAVDLPQSRIIETEDLWEVSIAAQQWGFNVGIENVLVVYDLDNTLLAMEQDLGSDQWYYWQKDLQTANRCDPRLVTDRLAAQGALLYASAMRPTQDNAAAIVQGLQSRGFTSIILTSRGPDFAAMTFRELRRNGLDFRDSTLGPENEPALIFKPAADSRDTRYESGVYLTAGQHKGNMLLALLNRTGTELPKVIIMADDKKENLQHVLDTFSDSGTAVLAYRYGREDAWVAAFDGDRTAEDWRKVEPALMQLQEVFGPDNFKLPEPSLPAGCETNIEDKQ